MARDAGRRRSRRLTRSRTGGFADPSETNGGWRARLDDGKARSGKEHGCDDVGLREAGARDLATGSSESAAGVHGGSLLRLSMAIPYSQTERKEG